MRELYLNNTANYPRLKTDTFFADYTNSYKYSGILDKTFKFVEDFQLKDVTLWKRFVQQFVENADSENLGWRGEYWGKMMRGACFVYSYTQDAGLYEIITRTIIDIMETADEYGRISSFNMDCEFGGWDVWSRKYVLLGMQYFLEICKDKEFEKKIIKSMCGQVDYIMSKIGNEEDGKLPITSATRHWRGLNSSSILEPIVRLYTLTQEKKYLDFAEYIVNCGGTDVINVFDFAYINDFRLYQYPVTKAYEMTSCFEGLLEYYRITGNEKHKIAIINYANRILEDDFTVIGCSGCTHELFDHSTARQANTTNHYVMQETCVTVTLMKFFYQLNLLTGDSKYADAFETALYNAYLGSVNTEKAVEPFMYEQHSDWEIEPLPFSSYSPLTSGTRGKHVGGMLRLSDNHYYGCCACIGSAGIGLVPKMQLLASEKGFALNLYVDGKVDATTPKGNRVTFKTSTKYPREGNVIVTLDIAKKESFEVLIRNPYWSKTTCVSVNGKAASVNEGYISLEREWETGDTIEINLDMRCEAIYPIPYGSEILMNKVIWGNNSMVVQTYDREDPMAKHHIALRRGPVMLAQDSRLGYSVDEAIEVLVNADGYVDVELADNAPYENMLAAYVPLKDGTKMLVTDYASAGKLYTEENKMAVWMLTK